MGYSADATFLNYLNKNWEKIDFYGSEKIEPTNNPREYPTKLSAIAITKKTP